MVRKTASKDAVDSVFALIGETLASGEDVRIAGFRTVGTRIRPARTGRNPSTGRGVAISTRRPQRGVNGGVIMYRRGGVKMYHGPRR